MRTFNYLTASEKESILKLMQTYGLPSLIMGIARVCNDNSAFADSEDEQQLWERREVSLEDFAETI